MPDDLIQQEPLLLTRAKVCRMLMITVREYTALIEAGKFHPIYTKQRHQRIPIGEVIALKSELAHRGTVIPHEKFVQAICAFSENAFDVNRYLSEIGYLRVPVDYIERLRTHLNSDPNLNIVRATTFIGLMQGLGKAAEIRKREDLRLLIECLYMINKGEKEISETVKAKFGREYTPEDIYRYIEYFYNWKTMDPDSTRYYFEFLNGREKLLKECAHRRADYFIYYALGIDFGGDISDLIERSCLGLMHKLNFFIDGYVYGDAQISQRDLQAMSTIIQTLLGSAKMVREGKVPKGKQGEIVDKTIPQAFDRTSFFETEKKVKFDANPK